MATFSKLARCDHSALGISDRQERVPAPTCSVAGAQPLARRARPGRDTVQLDAKTPFHYWPPSLQVAWDRMFAKGLIAAMNAEDYWRVRYAWFPRNLWRLHTGLAVRMPGVAAGTTPGEEKREGVGEGKRRVI